MHTLQIVLHSTIATAKSSKIQELIRLQKANTNHISKKVTYAIYDHLLFTLALHFIQQILPFPQQRIPNHQKQREKENRQIHHFIRSKKVHGPIHFFDSNELHCAIIFDALVIASVI